MPTSRAKLVSSQCPVVMLAWYQCVTNNCCNKPLRRSDSLHCAGMYCDVVERLAHNHLEVTFIAPNRQRQALAPGGYWGHAVPWLRCGHWDRILNAAEGTG